MVTCIRYSQENLDYDVIHCSGIGPFYVEERLTMMEPAILQFVIEVDERNRALDTEASYRQLHWSTDMYLLNVNGHSDCLEICLAPQFSPCE